MSVLRTSGLLVAFFALPSLAGTTFSSCHAVARQILSDRASNDCFSITGQVLQVCRAASMTEIALKDASGAVIVKSKSSQAVTPGDILAVSGRMRTGY